jgi:hypothetical protein
MDVNTNAFRIVQRLTSENKGGKAPLGRAGGLKGGRARADALTPQRRQEIARKAIETRWKKQPGTLP